MILSAVFMPVQGDLRDILHLRQNLLRAVLGLLEWKVPVPVLL